MMPHPVRADEPLGRGEPVARAGQYAIDHIIIGAAKLSSPSAVLLRVEEAILRNASHHAKELQFKERRRQIEHIWRSSSKLPENIGSLVISHKNLVRKAGPVTEEVEQIVADLQQVMTETGADYGIIYRSEGEDVVPHLLKTLEWGQEPPEPPVSVDEIDPDDIEIRRRTIKDWKRWANSRGAASAKFRQAVRRAYNYTCLICGVHLPTTEFNAVAGVDAAHILPWAQYELDHISNGLCLCRLHHWAFDEGLLVIRTDGHTYTVEVPEEIVHGILSQNPSFSLDQVLRFAGPIPDDRLPADKRNRPRPRFLELLSQSHE